MQMCFGLGNQLLVMLLLTYLSNQRVCIFKVRSGLLKNCYTGLLALNYANCLNQSVVFIKKQSPPSPFADLLFVLQLHN